MPQHINGDTGEVTEGRDATVILLEKEFPARAIKSRQGGGNKVFSYVSTDTVIRRLNEATDNQWDFQIVKYEFLPAINRDQQQEQIMLVQGRLTIPGLGSREGFGVQRLASPIVNTDDLLKAAAGDALKRAAVSFGVAIDLYGPDLEGGAEPTHPDNIPGVTRGMPQNNATAPQRGAAGGQAQSSQPSRSDAPVSSGGDSRIPATYPRVSGISNTADVIEYMRRNNVHVDADNLGAAIKAANAYGKEMFGIEKIVVPTGKVNPEKPQYGPSTFPSDVANALGYWFSREGEAREAVAHPVPAPRVGGTLPGEEPQDFDSDVPF